MSKFDTDKPPAFRYSQFMVTGFTVQEEKNNSANKPSAKLCSIVKHGAIEPMLSYVEAKKPFKIGTEGEQTSYIRITGITSPSY